jgi:RimJ/RimL family protein N-acetyltransferase
MNADPEVTRYFVAPLSREQSDTLAARLAQHIDQHGWGLWAVEIPAVASFAGFIGVAAPGFDAPFTPCMEIGWRLAPDVWGRGYATEGARAVVAFAFENLRLDELVSFTSAGNLPSRRVMERLGMVHNPQDDFEHPKLSPGHPLRPHVLYRIGRGDGAATSRRRGEL